MENATKALIIAASILIVIVLIAIGMKILSSASGVVDNVGDVSSAMEISIFNSQFEQYEGTQRGSALKTLFSRVIANNANAENGKKITFVYLRADGRGWGATPGQSNYNTSISTIESQLSQNASCNFTVTIERDGNTGLINKITAKNQER